MSCKKGYDSVYFIDGIDKKIETIIPIIRDSAIYQLLFPIAKPSALPFTGTE